MWGLGLHPVIVATRSAYSPAAVIRYRLRTAASNPLALTSPHALNAVADLPLALDKERLAVPVEADGGDGEARPDDAARLLEVLRVGLRELGKVRDARVGGPEGFEALEGGLFLDHWASGPWRRNGDLAMGLELLDPLLLDHLEVPDAVLGGPLVEALQPAHLVRCHRHDELPDLLVRHLVSICPVGKRPRGAEEAGESYALLVGIVVDLVNALDAELGLEGAGCVVDARVQDAAVPLRLVRGWSQVGRSSGLRFGLVGVM